MSEFRPEGRFVEANQYLDQSDKLNALWERDGYLFFRDVLDKAEIRHVKNDFIRVLQNHGAVAKEANEPIWTGCKIDVIDDNDLYGLRSYQALCEAPGTVALLEKVFGEPVYVYRNTS